MCQSVFGSKSRLEVARHRLSPGDPYRSLSLRGCETGEPSKRSVPRTWLSASLANGLHSRGVTCAFVGRECRVGPLEVRIPASVGMPKGAGGGQAARKRSGRRQTVAPVRSEHTGARDGVDLCTLDPRGLDLDREGEVLGRFDPNSSLDIDRSRVTQR